MTKAKERMKKIETYPFIKVAHCPSCNRKRRLTVMGSVFPLGVMAICPGGHFLKGKA